MALRCRSGGLPTRQSRTIFFVVQNATSQIRSAKQLGLRKFCRVDCCVRAIAAFMTSQSPLFANFGFGSREPVPRTMHASFNIVAVQTESPQFPAAAVRARNAEAPGGSKWRSCHGATPCCDVCNNTCVYFA